MDKPNGKKPFEVMSYEQFQQLVQNHIWTFQCDTFMELNTSIKEENDLFYTGKMAGPKYLRYLLRMMKNAMQELPLFQQAKEVVKEEAPVSDVVTYTQAQVDELLRQRTDQINAMMATEDPDFDLFRVRCHNHDWYYTFSDSNEVFKRGQDNQAKLEEEAVKRGGKYFDFWQYKLSQVQ